MLRNSCDRWSDVAARRIVNTWGSDGPTPWRLDKKSKSFAPTPFPLVRMRFGFGPPLARIWAGSESDTGRLFVRCGRQDSNTRHRMTAANRGTIEQSLEKKLGQDRLRAGK